MNDTELILCPLCGGLESQFLFSIKTPYSNFSIVKCRVCGLARTFPFPNDENLKPNDVFYSYYGKGSSKFGFRLQKIRDLLMRKRAKYYLSLIPSSTRTPKVLDVGCAEGRLLRSFLDLGCSCFGVEHPFYPAQRFLRREQIVYLQGDLEDIDFPKETFDLIFLWHVLEHMDNPQQVMGRLYDFLSPDGAIIMAVPNFSSAEARRFKQWWFHLDIPWHKYHFSKNPLVYLMRKVNLRIVSISTFCLEQGPYGLLQSILNASGWPHNELYEALKGNIKLNIGLIFQFFIGMFLLIPLFFITLLISSKESGPVLKLILRKEKNG